MATLIESISEERLIYTKKDALTVLFNKLDKAIDDIENSRFQAIDEAWEEIDKI